VKSNGCTKANNVLERFKKVVVVAEFKELSRHVARRTDGNRNNKKKKRN
jgi:hypothetical protein